METITYIKMEDVEERIEQIVKDLKEIGWLK